MIPKFENEKTECRKNLRLAVPMRFQESVLWSCKQPNHLIFSDAFAFSCFAAGTDWKTIRHKLSRSQSRIRATLTSNGFNLPLASCFNSLKHAKTAAFWISAQSSSAQRSAMPVAFKGPSSQHNGQTNYKVMIRICGTLLGILSLQTCPIWTQACGSRINMNKIEQNRSGRLV